MKKLLILVLALLLVGCQPNEITTSQAANATRTTNVSESASTTTSSSTSTTATEAAVYQTVTADKVKEWLDGGESIVIVDVRTQGEYDSGHIPGAVVIPNETIGNKEPSELSDKDAIIVVYCRSGRRSRESANKLLKLGYKNVYDLGGIGNWPYDIEKPGQ